MAESAKIHGLKELEANFNSLAEQVRARGVRLILSRGAVPMRDEARRRAPVLKAPRAGRRAGVLQENVKIWRHRKSPFAATYYVGVRALSRAAVSKFKKATGRDGKDNPEDPFYWRWQELGNSRHRPQPFLRPAFESKKMESVRVALETARAFIVRAARGFKRVRR